eukprot:TRINITY_DN6475_c0_g1_i2.p1 TRINITY_DN6475_c0_g1~~TRINITY_DN6475_c0_g1_i2.p1  ORF type:complete len:761 (+),score=138.72 TRINITY_DN6475_c0_g1_i2:86-2368(+)
MAWIYRGQVSHVRYSPVKHKFSYPLLTFAFDVDELESLQERIPLIGYNRVRLISIFDSDYLAGASGHGAGDARPIKEKVKQIITERLTNGRQIASQIARIILITSARYLNYAFNPVSFHYCYDRNEKLICIIAEVNNTFDESHVYVLPSESHDSLITTDFRARSAKQFHVSPFNDTSGEYVFRFSSLEKELNVVINLVKENQIHMTAFIRAPEKICIEKTSDVYQAMLGYPFTLFLTSPRIMWEAAKLHYKKRLPVYAKPNPISNDTIGRQQPSPLAQREMDRVFSFLQGRAKATEQNIVCRLVNDPGNPVIIQGAPKTGKESIVVDIHNLEFFSRVNVSAGYGLVESFGAGDWSCLSLDRLLGLFERDCRRAKIHMRASPKKLESSHTSKLYDCVDLAIPEEEFERISQEHNISAQTVIVDLSGRLSLFSQWLNAKLKCTILCLTFDANQPAREDQYNWKIRHDAVHYITDLYEVSSRLKDALPLFVEKILCPDVRPVHVEESLQLCRANGTRDCVYIGSRRKLSAECSCNLCFSLQEFSRSSQTSISVSPEQLRSVVCNEDGVCRVDYANSTGSESGAWEPQTVFGAQGLLAKLRNFADRVVRSWMMAAEHFIMPALSEFVSSPYDESLHWESAQSLLLYGDCQRYKAHEKSETKFLCGAHWQERQKGRHQKTDNAPFCRTIADNAQTSESVVSHLKQRLAADAEQTTGGQPEASSRLIEQDVKQNQSLQASRLVQLHATWMLREWMNDAMELWIGSW